MQSGKTLEKLEWSLLTTRLANYAQTDEGQAACNALIPNRDKDTIANRWTDVTALRDIARSGYKAPVGSLKKPHQVFKAAEKGQLLEGSDFRLVFEILMSTKRVLAFAASFASKSMALQHARGAAN